MTEGRDVLGDDNLRALFCEQQRNATTDTLDTDIQ